MITAPIPSVLFLSSISLDSAQPQTLTRTVLHVDFGQRRRIVVTGTGGGDCKTHNTYSNNSQAITLDRQWPQNRFPPSNRALVAVPSKAKLYFRITWAPVSVSYRCACRKPRLWTSALLSHTELGWLSTRPGNYNLGGWIQTCLVFIYTFPGFNPRGSQPTVIHVQ